MDENKIKSIKRRPLFSIRKKLFILVLLPFAIPWIGYLYINDMESLLRQKEVININSVIKSTSSILENLPEIFPSNSYNQENLIYVKKINRPINIDGYNDEWFAVMDSPRTMANNKYRLYFARNKGYLNIFIEADKKMQYCGSADIFPSFCDYIKLHMPRFGGNNNVYLLSTSAPGNIVARRYIVEQNEITPEPRIRAALQETKSGYNIEIRIPDYLVDNNIAVDIADSKANTLIIHSSSTNEPFNYLYTPSDKIESILNSLQQSGVRIWVTDINGTVVAKSDRIKDNNLIDDEDGIINILSTAFYRLLLSSSSTDFYDTLKSSTAINNDIVRKSLKGESSHYWHDTSNRKIRILSAATPVRIKNNIVGSVIAEKTNNEILFLQNKALARIINISMGFFIITLTIIIFFSARLSKRIVKLHLQSEKAITADGRINLNEEFCIISGNDEITALSLSLKSLINRVSGYNHHLETLAGKLSHELKTPLAIVSSSLENLQFIDNKQEQKKFIERAISGANRLKKMLSAISEASRLEKSLQNYEFDEFDLSDLLQTYIDGFCTTFPELSIIIESNEKTIINGNKELIAQLLDKIFSNARDFHEPDSKIKSSIIKNSNEAIIIIANKGEPVAESVITQIFEPMVSTRHGDSKIAHFGLGLYIVKLIAEYHGGTVMAKNSSNGFAIIITLPIIQ
ncbi:MAG: hypothetical protein D6B27_05430 [Gammaproteobacteria bacterium]|nr:MAG: hypothetical protein D6B27_05430 [Gammaproteobacteria bacterium]